MPQAIPVIVMVAATAASAYASYSQGQQQAQASRQNAQAARVNAAVAQTQAEFNARRAERQAAETRDQAQYDEARARERAAFLLSDQRARLGAAGVDLTGSPIEVLGFQAGQSELDALAIRRRGATAYGDLMEEAGLQRYRGGLAVTQGAAQASIDEQRASQAATAGTYRAGSTILSGLSGAWNSYGGQITAGWDRLFATT
ncbi:hypothetical protein [Neoroseomonas oryzicola]|uniref:Phage protein n=1 Tax=Neoroseomonas oryzicola TaxID=535904 RepID=A0A9X9WIQ3_9PROT|nr:hypothetical protein [Neoroseomonas oryzicola]MBR0660213.1 hypothetical protein [Neoroseomonas oryzicola]NKE16712.1 hypothetical protein [Neoroseomonas oryzicola]